MSEDEDDLAIYGDGAGGPSVPAVADGFEPERVWPSGIAAVPAIPLVLIRASFANPDESWWITDEDIDRAIAPLGAVEDLVMDQAPRNGRFGGGFECRIRTERPAAEVAEEVQTLAIAGQALRDVVAPHAKAAPAAVAAAAPGRAPRPAPMLYEDPKAPIPKKLLRASSEKKTDDGRRAKRKKEREREGRRRDDRDRERRHRDDYDGDRRRKGDRERRRRDSDERRSKRRR